MELGGRFLVFGKEQATNYGKTANVLSIEKCVGASLEQYKSSENIIWQLELPLYSENSVVGIAVE